MDKIEMEKHNVIHILISEKIFSHMPHLPTINMLISKKHSINCFLFFFVASKL